jgi:hypothetical protein
MNDLAGMRSDLNSLKEGFHEHSREDREDFGRIRGHLEKIETNHLAHMQDSMISMASDMKEIKNGLSANTRDTAEARSNIGWIMKIGGGVLSTILVAVVGLIFLILRKGAGL